MAGTPKDVNYIDLYRLIAKEVSKKPEASINIAQVKDCLSAYGTILTTLTKKGIDVPLPHVGTFKSKRKKGFEGGDVAYPFFNKDTGESGMLTKYKDPELDYLLLQFRVTSAYQNRFKEDTKIKE